MNLNQYVLTCITEGVVTDPVAIKASSKDSAWGKFITQRFGALKPSRKDWKIEQVSA